mmetsp:Transcript_6036/g.17840  ORF Transcript_6036/g.17840 Transcript_6036/m.17840 type:complete len:279 (+) Transcript_6036:993-1829(+)
MGKGHGLAARRRLKARSRLLGQADDADRGMVLQVPAHRGHVGHGPDAQAPELLLVSHAAEEQQVGRADGARGQDHLPRRAQREHLATVEFHLHGRGAPGAVEDHAPHERLADHAEVPPRPQHRLDERVERVAASARGALHGELRRPAALLPWTVVVSASVDPICSAGLKEGRHLRNLREDGARLHWATVATMRSGSAPEALCDPFEARKVRGHTVETPLLAAATLVGPTVEVLALAMNPHEPVNGRAAAQTEPPLHVDCTALGQQVLLRLRPETPVHL